MVSKKDFLLNRVGKKKAHQGENNVHIKRVEKGKSEWIFSTINVEGFLKGFFRSEFSACSRGIDKFFFSPPSAANGKSLLCYAVCPSRRLLHVKTRSVLFSCYTQQPFVLQWTLWSLTGHFGIHNGDKDREKCKRPPVEKQSNGIPRRQTSAYCSTTRLTEYGWRSSSENLTGEKNNWEADF